MVSEQGHDPENPSAIGRFTKTFKGLDKWAQWAAILALPLIAVGSLASIAALNNPPKPLPTQSASPVQSASPIQSASPAPVSSASSSAAGGSGQGGIPSADLGSWGGLVKQANGATERFIINLTQGVPGNSVGTFSNQTAPCQGTILLNGDTTVTLDGASVPAADLDLETTQNPDNICAPSVEAYVASADGSELVYEVVTAGTLQGSFESPLAIGDLSH